MRRRGLKWTALLVGAVAAIALAEDFTWTDDGVGHSYDTDLNWFSSVAGYPDGTDDAALIPGSPAAGWDIDLTIDDVGTVTITGDVAFAAGEAGAILTVDDFFKISAPAEDPLTVTITDATIKINAP